MFALFTKNTNDIKPLPAVTGRLETTLDQLVNDIGETLSEQVYKVDISEYLSEYSHLSTLPTKVQNCVRAVLDDYLNAEREAYFQINEFIFGVYLGSTTKTVAELKIQVIRNELLRVIEQLKQQKPIAINENCDRRRVRAASLINDATSEEQETPEATSEEMRMRDWASRALGNMSKDNGLEEFQKDIMRLSKILELEFKPLWYVQNNILSGYIVKTTSSSVQFEHHYKQAQADIAVLAAAVQRLKSMIERNELALLVVPVHVQTICTSTTRELFNIYCHSIEPKLKKFLVLHIKGIDASKMMQTDRAFLNIAAKHFRSITIEPPRKKLDFKDLPPNFHAFCLDLTDLYMREKYLFNLIESFAGHYQKDGRRCFILGVETKSLLLAAVNAGYSYISGPAIAPCKSSPEHARFLELETLYRACSKA